MRKSSGFLLTLAACLLLEACLRSAPTPDPGRRPSELAAGDAERRLAAAKPKLMSADYRADLEELAQLRDEVL